MVCLQQSKGCLFSVLTEIFMNEDQFCKKFIRMEGQHIPPHMSDYQGALVSGMLKCQEAGEEIPCEIQRYTHRDLCDYIKQNQMD